MNTVESYIRSIQYSPKYSGWQPWVQRPSTWLQVVLCLQNPHVSLHSAPYDPLVHAEISGREKRSVTCIVVHIHHVLIKAMQWREQRHLVH